MKNLLVILDGTAGARQATYTAYDVAARTGARLVGAVLSADRESELGKQTRREFEIGARAAGVRASLKEISKMAEAWSTAQEMTADAIFVGQNSLTTKTELEQYLGGSACPLWIIPVQREIHRLLVLYDSSPAATLALEQGLDLANRWGLDLTLLATSTPSVALDDLLPKGFADEVQLNLQVITQPDQAAVYDQINNQDIDLALIGQPQDMSLLWDFSQRAKCLLAIYPALKSF